MGILLSVLTLGGLGFLFGLGLLFASKKFCVTADPRVEKVLSKLPGSNCGACGMAGCMGFAEGLIKGTCTPEGCQVSKDEERKDIAEILGIEVKETVKKAAVLHCGGGNKVKNRFVYQGIEDCIAANQLQGGQKACVWGCLGFGTCARACPFGAITMTDQGLPQVNEDKCTSCGICVKVCPKNLFSLVPKGKKFYVACSSRDMGKKVMEVCPVGCIACRKCEKSCPVSAIKVIDNLAVFDYNKCENIGKCYEVCPTKCIKGR